MRRALKGAGLESEFIISVWGRGYRTPELTSAVEKEESPHPTPKSRVPYVLGPYGDVLTLNDLPPPGMKRWVVRRKAEVVAAVRGGLLSPEDACRRYTLTVDEFLAWQRAVERYGTPGLRATRVQEYR